MAITSDPVPPILGSSKIEHDARPMIRLPRHRPGPAAPPRRDPLVIVAAVALAAAGLVAVLGVVMASNARFAETYVRDQLLQQRITFKTADTLTEEERRSACLVRYAGQQLSTGKQAECYANDFIGLHVKEVANGQTYAELGGPERALTAKVAAAEKAGDPALADLQKQLAALRAQRGTLFQGETSRGLLLTSFGFSDLGAKAGQAATVAFSTAAALVLLAAGCIARRALQVRGGAGPRRTPGSPAD